MPLACGAGTGLCDHHGDEKQSLAAPGRPERTPWLAVATPLGLRGLAGRQRLCRTHVAPRRQDGVCACGHHAGAQAVSLSGGDRAPGADLAPLAQTRYFASSDLEADAQTLLGHIAARWDIEVLFGDGKEELGLDHYQVMSATALLRFWTLAMLAYVFLEEERQRLQTQGQRPVTIGEARREIQRRLRRNVLLWLHAQFQSGVQPDALFDLFAA